MNAYLYRGIILFLTLIIYCGCDLRLLGEKMNAEDYFRDPNNVALVRAAASGDIKEIDELVNKGVNVNVVGHQDMTPLIWTLIHKNKRSLRRLLELGADPNFVAQNGASSVTIAAGANDQDYLKIILKNEGNPNLIDTETGKTALMVATCQKRLENIDLLLEYGADIDGKGRFGSTALLTAAALNFFDVVHYLLERGADPDIRNPTGADLFYYVENNRISTKSPLSEWRDKVEGLLVARETGLTRK